MTKIKQHIEDSLEKKSNKYGCKPSQDVCLIHDCPLVTYGICEDSPELQEFIKEVKKQSQIELIEIIRREVENLPYIETYDVDDFPAVKRQDVLDLLKTNKE